MDAAVGLTKSLEDDVVLVRLDADAGVAHRERHGRGPAAEDPQVDLALLRELQRIGQQILQNLAEPLRIGTDFVRRSGLDGRRELAAAFPPPAAGTT